MPLDPALLAKIAPLDVRARRVVEGYVAGRHKSPHRGFSVEFAEHRDYAPGDDLRYVDWKLHAKTDRFHLKQFEEETNFAAHLLLDVSESMTYRSDAAAWSKLDCGKTLAAAVAHLVVRQRDAVGLALVDRERRTVLPPSSRPSHVADLTRALDEAGPGRETALGPVLHDIAERLGRRGLVVLVSDLLDDPDAVLRGLRHLAHRRHDVRVLHLVDPAEEDFPFDEPLRFLGLEGQPDVTADAAGLRRGYRTEFDAHRRAIEAGCRDMGATYLFGRTDAPPERLLADLVRAT